jgi:taurine transport system permease protein
MTERTKLRLVSVIAFIAFLLVWQYVTSQGYIKPLFLPSPVDIVRRGASMFSQGKLLVHVVASARRVLMGFALASVLAVPLGIMAGRSRTMWAILSPFISVIRPLPSMSWIPLSLLWIGIREEQKYAIVFMGTFALVLLYTFEATKNIDSIYIRAARNLGASNLDVMREVVLPGSLPSIMSGLKATLGVSWTCVISAELVAANEGLGYLIMHGKEFFLTDQVLLGMAMISLTVFLIDVLYSRLEQILIPWR